jgi:tetratricopeptide (TPR) repeat protein
MEAIDSFNQAIKLKPDFDYAYNNKGNVLYTIGKYQEAIDSYNNAI